MHASAARPRREARPFYRLIERDMPLRAAFWPEVREFISHKGCQFSVSKRMVVWSQGLWPLGPQHGWKVRDIARYCAILCGHVRYCAILFDI